MSHFSYNPAVCKINLHERAGDQVARPDKTHAAFRDIHHAGSFGLAGCPFGGRNADRVIRNAADLASLLGTVAGEWGRHGKIAAELAERCWNGR